MKNGREKNLTRKKKHFSICVFFLLIFHTIVSSSAEFNDVSSGTIYYSFFFVYIATAPTVCGPIEPLN